MWAKISSAEIQLFENKIMRSHNFCKHLSNDVSLWNKSQLQLYGDKNPNPTLWRNTSSNLIAENSI